VGGCYTYQYDGNGNSTLGVNRDGHLNHGLYNGLNELVQGYTESYPATATVSYGYDAAGDTTAITTPVGLTNPTDPHALNTHFQYNPQGWLTTATYLSKGALVTLTQAYNAQGQRSRYSLSSNGAPPLDTFFTYDAAGHVSQETVVTNTATGPQLVFDNLYLYTQDGRPWMFLHTDPTTTPATVPYWYTLDGQGDVVAVTDQSGAVVDRYAYNQWGRETGNDATDEEVPQQLRYRGIYYDEQPARYWMSDNRAYDPALERYLQPDGNRSHVFAHDDPTGQGPQPTPIGTPGSTPTPCILNGTHGTTCEGATTPTPTVTPGSRKGGIVLPIPVMPIAPEAGMHGFPPDATWAWEGQDSQASLSSLHKRVSDPHFNLRFQARNGGDNRPNWHIRVQVEHVGSNSVRFSYTADSDVGRITGVEESSGRDLEHAIDRAGSKAGYALYGKIATESALTGADQESFDGAGGGGDLATAIVVLVVIALL